MAGITLGTIAAISAITASAASVGKTLTQKGPKAPDPLAPLPPTPDITTAPDRNATIETLARQRRRAGNSSAPDTLLTGPSGLGTAAPVTYKTLLGS